MGEQTCLEKAARSAVAGTAVGGFTGAIKVFFDLYQPTPAEQAEAATSKAGRGILTRIARQMPTTRVSPAVTIVSHVALFAGAAVVFSAAECIAENAREREDWKNGAIGGCAAGATFGLKNGKLATSIGGCAGTAAMLTFVEIAGDGAIFPQHDQTQGPKRTVLAQSQESSPSK